MVNIRFYWKKKRRSLDLWYELFFMTAFHSLRRLIFVFFTGLNDHSFEVTPVSDTVPTTIKTYLLVSQR